MSLLTQALTLGLAFASISAFGRRSRMVIVLDVTQNLYHGSRTAATHFPDRANGPNSQLLSNQGILMRLR